MEILLWLLPAALVTLGAMVWVSWLGRDGRGEVDREVAVRRMTAAMGKDFTPRRATPARPADRSSGIAVRPSRRD